MNWLNKLQQKTDAEKRIISFNVAFILTIFIFTAWAIVTFYSFQGNGGGKDEVSASPFSSLTASVKNIFKGETGTYVAPE